MGVSGSGKSTVGHAPAERLGRQFIDGDELHPPRNIAKMSAGRIAERHDQFLPATLLQSQFATLEPSSAEEDAIVVEIDKTIGAIVEEIVTALSLRQASMTAPA